MSESFPKDRQPHPESEVQEVPVPEVDRENPIPPDLIRANIDDFLEREEELDEERDHPHLPN